MRIYTVELSGYDPTLPGLRTLYFCTGLGFISRPSDSPSNQIFAPNLTQPALIQVNAFEYGRTGGRSQIAVGTLTLGNADGTLDYLTDWGLDGRTLTLRVGEETGAYPATFTTVLTAVIESVKVGPKTVEIKLRDRQLLVDKEFNANRYAGTNVLPAGLEGLPTDIQGLPKPRLYGKANNVQPVQVNSARLIYQVNDGAVYDITAVYDRGAALTKGADYTSQLDMETNAPAAGSYRIWKSGGCFRLGATPSGVITCNPVQGATASERTAGFIAKAILTGPGGLLTGELDLTSFTDLDTANSAECGVYVREEVNVPEIMDFLATSVGAYWGVNRAGLFHIRRLEAPSGTPVYDLTKDNVFDITRDAAPNGSVNIPPYAVAFFYSRNYTVQTSDLAGSVTAARRGELAQEWLQVVVSDPAMQTLHPLAPAVGTFSAIQSEADAEAEAIRLLTLHGTKRELVTVPVVLDDTVAAILDLGSVVRLTYSRYGYGSGKLFVVLGFTIDSRSNRAILTLWG